MAQITRLVNNLLSVKEKNIRKDFLLVGGIQVGVFLILFTPLIFGPFGLTLSSYPKAVFFRTLIEIIFILYLLLIYFNPKYLPKISLLVIMVSAFVGILLLSSLTGVNFHQSFFGDLARTEGVILHIHLLLFFLILINIFHKKQEWFNLLRVTLIVSAISSLAAVLQKLNIYSFYAIDPQRVSGTFTNPDFFAPYMVLSIFLGLLVILGEKGKVLKILWASILILNFSMLILSGMRAAWIGMGAGIIFLFSFWLFRYSYKQPKLRRIILFFVLVLLLFVLFIVVNQDRLPVRESVLFQRAMSVFNIETLSSRFPAWSIALRAWQERPILGWGPESFGFVYDKFFQASYLQYIGEDIFFDRAHNTFLDLMASTGILGLLSYLSIFFALFYLIFKYNNKQAGPLYALILASLLVAYLTQNFFSFDTISTYILFFLIIGFVNNNFRGEYRESIQPSLKVSSQKFLNIFLVLSYISFSLIAMYQLNFKPTKASLTIIQGAKLGQKDFHQSLTLFKEGMTQKTIYDEDFKIELTERLLDISEGSLPAETQKEIVEIFAGLKPFFEEKLKKPHKIHRNFYEILFGINAKIYLFTGDRDFLRDMEAVSQKALEFNNQKPRFYQMAGKAKILQKEYQIGEALLQKSFELTPRRLSDKINFHKNSGIAYLLAGEKLKAADHFKKAVDIDYYLRKFTSYYGNPQKDVLFAEKTALMYCRDFNDFETCRQIYEKTIEVYPEHRDWLQSHLETLIKQREG